MKIWTTDQYGRTVETDVPFVSPRRRRLERRARIEGWLWFLLFVALCVAITLTKGW